MKLKTSLLVLFFILLMNKNALSQENSWTDIHNPSISFLKKNFNNPPSEYASHVIWGLDGNITDRVIKNDLDSIKARGFKSVIIEAGYHLPCKYLSSGWFKLVKRIVVEAKKRNLKLWIIDEGKYPSGFAGGKFSEYKSELRMQALVNKGVIDIKSGDILKDYIVDNNVFSAVAVSMSGERNQEIQIVDHKFSFKAGMNTWKIILAGADFRTGQTRCVNNPTGAKDTKNSQMDYMNPKAVRQFIDWTHEEYKKYIGKEFGKTVMGFRGDEPDYSYIPYTPAIIDSFKVLKGYDPSMYMASLLTSSLTEKEKRFKADYYDVWSRLFADNYFKQVADWCRDNGVAHVTHLNNDHNMPACVRCEGNLFRDLSKVQIPGIDAIWNQIWPDTINDYPKFVSSVSHVYGKPRSFSESFAAYYNNPTIPEAKYVVDYQMVRGINFFEFMFWMANSQNQGWISQPGMHQLNDYTNRTAYLLTQGKPGARIAMYYPVSSLWLGDNKVADRIKNITHSLLQHQKDFDYIDDDAFIEASKVENGCLINKSGQAYSTLIIPSADVISDKTWIVIKEFKRQGGKVLYWGSLPYYIVGKSFNDRTRFDIDDNSAVESSDSYTATVDAMMPRPELLIKNRQPMETNKIPRRGGDPKRLPIDQTLDIRYTRRVLPEGEFYFIFNEGHYNQKVSVGMDIIGNVTNWDGCKGVISDMSSTISDDRTWTELDMKPFETVMLFVTKQNRKYKITDYGVLGDGRTINTRAIQSAIDSVYYNGGGTLVIPKGNFLTGALFFHRGVNLNIEKEAKLISTTNDTDFPVISTRFEGIEQPWKSALLNFIDCKDVIVSGNGTIDGRGGEWESHPFGNSGRPRLMCFTRCNGGRLSGLLLKDQASWCVHILYTDNFKVDGTVIRAEHTIPSSDGIDIDSSRGVSVLNTDIEDNDDCISIKSGKDEDGRRVARPSENIIVKKCRFGYGHSGVDIGSEVSGDVRNVTVEDCVMDKDNAGGIRIKSQPSRGGVIENIKFKNITLNNPRTVFDINMRWRMVPPFAPDASVQTQLRNICLENIHGQCMNAGKILGTENCPVTGLSFINCSIKANTGLETKNIKNSDFNGLDLMINGKRQTLTD